VIFSDGKGDYVIFLSAVQRSLTKNGVEFQYEAG